MSIRDLFNRLTGKVVATSVTANNASVAINGPNSAPVTINSLDTIIEAVSKSNAEQYAVISQGVLGDLHTEFDRQVDQYREKMNSGAIKIALELFDKLLSDQEDKLSDLLIFRIKANIALCHYQLGDLVRAPNLLLEACTYAPDDRRAIANKVLAFLLQGDCDKALAFGSQKMQEDPNNELLAGFLLQATRIKYQNEAEFIDPFAQFSERVQLNRSVRIAHIHLLASRRFEGWRAMAQEFLEEYPDDAQAKNLIAIGILNHYVEHRQSANGFIFTSEEVDELKLAAEYISVEWQEFKSSDRVAHNGDLQNIQNLLILYKITNDVAALVAECTYVLTKLTDDQGVIETTARSLIDIQETELFEQAVQKVENPIGAKKLRFLNKVARKDWEGLSNFQDYSLEKFDDQFASHAKVVVYIARAFVGQARGKEQLAQLLASCELDSRGRLLLFEFAAASKINSVARMAHAYGSDRVSERSEVIEFFHYMKLVRFLMLWREIVLRLESHPAASENYELKHMLALGFLNEYPIRAEAVDFFEKYVIPKPEGFELLSGVFYFKRNDFSRAVPLVEKYLENGGSDLFAFIVLCDIAKLNNDNIALKRLFDTYAPGSLEGTPEQRIHVAKVRASIGDGAEALAEAYRMLIDFPDSAAVALGYFSIFLMTEKTEILDSTTVVGNLCHYRLASSEGEALEKTVESNTGDLLALSPERVDLYTRRVWGQEVGYEFTQEKLQGNVVWRLEEVKHHYLHAFHNVCNNYESQFPDAGGLWALKLGDDGVQPLLDFMQRQAERNETLFGEILDKHMPLEIASGISEKNIFDLYDLIRSTGGLIRTCVGTKEERLNAMQLVEGYQGRPAILDTYAARVVVELGLLDFLKSYFGHVMVSHSTIQTLQMMAIDKAGFPYTEGSGHAHITSIVEKLQTTCEVVVFSFPRSLDELTEKLIELNVGSIAPYFIAKERGALFISEDSFSREFGAHIYEVSDSAWLQIVVNVLIQRRIISGAQYTHYVLGLAERKHSFVSVSAILLEHAYQSDTDGNLSQLSILCEFIGGPNAELDSHYQLILQFILARWLIDYNPGYDLALENMLIRSHGDAFPSAKAMKATSLLLERLIAIPGGRNKLFDLVDLPVLRLRRFIIGWWKGHFYIG
ncbi:hypothetical protein LG309_07730 [Stutzerimonas chloritidismutans]|uniref:PIN domain-containing protein n=1 Tax=Stutzerimonas chloritidismutans TaxID=203192 RepID=UPI00384D5449